MGARLRRDVWRLEPLRRAGTTHLAELAATEAESVMREIVYLPVNPRLPYRKLEQLAAATSDLLRTGLRVTASRRPSPPGEAEVP